MHSIPFVSIGSCTSTDPRIGKMELIEDTLGTSWKGEQAIQSLELALPAKSPTDIRSDLPEITALLDWFSPPSP